MEKDLEILNNELSELKRTLADFTETTEKRINDLLNEMDRSTEKTCDEELQDVINTFEDFFIIQACCENDASSYFFELFLSLFNVYGLDKETIEELYIDARECNNICNSKFDYVYYADLFRSDPTEFNLINFLERYCWEYEYDFTKSLNSVVKYKKATSVISELISLGFRRNQFEKIYSRDRFERTCELCYSDLLMITDVTREQLDILRNYEILFPERKNNTYFIFV